MNLPRAFHRVGHEVITSIMAAYYFLILGIFFPCYWLRLHLLFSDSSQMTLAERHQRCLYLTSSQGCPRCADSHRLRFCWYFYLSALWTFQSMTRHPISANFEQGEDIWERIFAIMSLRLANSEVTSLGRMLVGDSSIITGSLTVASTSSFADHIRAYDLSDALSFSWFYFFFVTQWQII